MNNNKNYYIDYEYYYKIRPNENDLENINNCIKIRTCFPKTIKKGTYIISAFPVISFDAMKEFYILQSLLKKPLEICATTGRWEGTPFSIYTTDNITITLEDEKLIQDYKFKVRFQYINE